ncbi:hypothetical protein SLEP1_g4060 [Rubroshorea leprosula]|uniref:Uncharacterized protein n=1 Tax=Rubroshorea leprosula TaxID=152421 RepID=A0AAV5HMZ0_9ROSI|nr:hypothetical protein SLEP1_g4060 [Rubroshorea leprosula]
MINSGCLTSRRGPHEPGMDCLSQQESQSETLEIPSGTSAVVTALSASGLATDEFRFVGFLFKHAGSWKERLIVSTNEARTQIFYFPLHQLCQFLEESSSIFGVLRPCVV